MFINSTITKKTLEILIQNIFLKFGISFSTYLLDSLKFLGFYYATNAGISINIEDLKTPNKKQFLINITNNKLNQINEQWKYGFISNTERFQNIIDFWNITTNNLKNKIIYYYQHFDPINNLFIMAFSGARGNISQVRQLLGMRGLMSDHEGKIIDLPIIVNFREGLSSVDYLTSSYGARKGIVDTAFKTADSGYLTRRLIYVAQDLIIKQINCNTQNGFLIKLKKNTQIKNLLGRSILCINKTYLFNNNFLKNEIIFTEQIFNNLKKFTPYFIKIRSPLTCNSLKSICQKCYGWELAHKKLISLGEAIGIIAAQSIGEPGTQLTMRTFHSGGIFTGDNVKQIFAPLTGNLNLSKRLNKTLYRSNHGLILYKLNEGITLKLKSWNNKEFNIFLDKGSFLYIKKSGLILKNQLLAEISIKKFLTLKKNLKPLYSFFSGEIKFESIHLYQIKKIKYLLKNGILWFNSGFIFNIPKESNYTLYNILNQQKSIFNLKLISPIKGIYYFSSNLIIIKNILKTYIFNFINLLKLNNNYVIKFYSLIKNYQYIENNIILGYFYIFSKKNKYKNLNKIKNYININKILNINIKDQWSIMSDQINYKFYNKLNYIKIKNKLFKNLKSKLSGYYLKQDGIKYFFQKTQPIFLNKGSILNYKQNTLINKNVLFATLLNFIQETDDIVQDLPKIEELLQVKNIINKSYLAIKSGIYLNFNILKIKTNLNLQNILIYNINSILHNVQIKNNLIQLFLIQNIFLTKKIFFFNNNFYNIKYITKKIKYLLLNFSIKDNFYFINQIFNTNFNLDNINLKYKFFNLNSWKQYKLITKQNIIYLFKNYKFKNWKLLKYYKTLTKQTFILFYKNNNNLIIQLKNNLFIYLKNLKQCNIYQLPINLKINLKPYQFINIGEPLTNGILNIHDLILILFMYHINFDNILIGAKKALTKFQLILLNSLQAIYESQNVYISSKHLELIIYQMTNKIYILNSGATSFLIGEYISFSYFIEIYQLLKEKNYIVPKFIIKIISITQNSLKKDGFLSSAGFQETQKILTKAAIFGKTDWLKNLKENLILGHLIPSGSTFLNYKNSLNLLYFLNNIKLNN